MPADQRRASILRSAGELFGRDGYAGTRLDDVAAAAGVTKPMVYRHFASKKALYLALLAKHRDDLPSFVAEAGPAVDAGIARDQLMRGILKVWLTYVRENRHVWLMLFRDSSGGAEIQRERRNLSSRAREVMAGFVTTVAGKSIPARQVDATAEVLTSGLAGLALWWIEHPRARKADVLEVAVRLGSAALAARPR